MDEPNKDADEIEAAHPGIKIMRNLACTQAELLYLAMQTHSSLKAMGWRETMYCPRDNSEWEFIENGSTGVFVGRRDEEGRFWLYDGGDVWPSSPYLFRARTKA